MLHVSPQREWTVRGELGYGFLGISDDEDEQPDGNLSYGGLHTGLLVHYSNPFGQPGANGAARDARGRVQAQSFGYNFFAGLRYRYLGDRTGTGVYYFLGRVFGLTAHGMSDWVGDAIGEAVWSIGYGIYWLLSRS